MGKAWGVLLKGGLRQLVGAMLQIFYNIGRKFVISYRVVSVFHTRMPNKLYFRT